MAVVKLSFVVFGSFAFIWHNIPLLIDESLSPLEFDEASKRRRLTHSLCGFYAGTCCSPNEQRMRYKATTMMVLKHVTRKSGNVSIFTNPATGK